MFALFSKQRVNWVFEDSESIENDYVVQESRADIILQIALILNNIRQNFKRFTLLTITG